MKKIILVLILISVVACTSPEKKIEEFIQSDQDIQNYIEFQPVKDRTIEEVEVDSLPGWCKVKTDGTSRFKKDRVYKTELFLDTTAELDFSIMFVYEPGNPEMQCMSTQFQPQSGLCRLDPPINCVDKPIMTKDSMSFAVLSNTKLKNLKFTAPTAMEAKRFLSFMIHRRSLRSQDVGIITTMGQWSGRWSQRHII